MVLVLKLHAGFCWAPLGSAGFLWIPLDSAGLGLGRAQPETRKARKPELFGPARWPVSPRAGKILGPTRTLFIFRATGQ